MRFLVTFLIGFICVLVESKLRPGDLISPCNLNDVEIEECIRSESKKLLPTMAKGIREWNLIGLDPITIPRIFIGQDSGPISLKWELINQTIAGFGIVEINKVTFDKKGDRYRFFYNTTTYNFTLTSEYVGKGRVLFIPINGEGSEYIHAQNSHIDFFMETKSEKRKSEEYLKIEKFRFYLRLGKVYVEFTNRLRKDSALSKAINNFINENVEEIVKEMMPTFEEAYGALLQEYIQKFFDKVPMKHLFKQ